MEDLKNASVTSFVAGGALLGCLASSTYFYKQNVLIHEHIEKLEETIKKLEEELSKNIRRQETFNKNQKNIMSNLNLTKDATQRIHYELMGTKNKLEDINEQVDTVEMNMEDFTKKLKESGIEIEIEKIDDRKRSKSIRSERSDRSERMQMSRSPVRSSYHQVNHQMNPPRRTTMQQSAVNSHVHAHTRGWNDNIFTNDNDGGDDDIDAMLGF